jgi:uncharacterized membrane protein (UPF0127 family)
MREKRFIPLALLVVLAFVGCKQKPEAPKSGLPVVDMKVGSRSYHMEVASDDFSRGKGLMERDSLPDDRGMIFVFLQDTDEPFWMKNTRFPLDILFIDSGGKIISIGHMKPFDETNTLPGGMYRYAIELNAGDAAAAGVKVGDSVAVPAAALH